MIKSMKIARYFTLVISILLAASCQKALDKPEVEAGFASKGEVPEVSIDMTNYNIVAEKGYATVTATYTGVPAADVVELGFLVSTSADMSSATSVILEQKTDGTYSANVKVTAGVTNYVMATAATLDGSVYSEILKLDVPKVLWYNLVGKQYVADLHSYYEENGCKYPGHVLGVDLDIENKTMTLSNLDAWAYAQGVPTSLTGVLDIENRTVTFDFSEGFVDAGLASYGFYSVALDPEALAAGSLSLIPELVVTFSETGEMSMPLYGTVNGQGQLADIYLPATYTAM